jgi:hypothetical protein
MIKEPSAIVLSTNSADSAEATAADRLPDEPKLSAETNPLPELKTLLAEEKTGSSSRAQEEVAKSTERMQCPTLMDMQPSAVILNPHNATAGETAAETAATAPDSTTKDNIAVQATPLLLDPVAVPRRTKTPSGSSGQEGEGSRANRDSYQLTKEEIEESLSFIKAKLNSTPLPPPKSKRSSGGGVAAASGSEDGRKSAEEPANSVHDYEPVQPLPPRETVAPAAQTVAPAVPLPETPPVVPVPLPVLVTEKGREQHNGRGPGAKGEPVQQNQFALECIPPVRPTRMKKGGTLEVPEWRPPKENVFAYFFGCFGVKNK